MNTTNLILTNLLKNKSLLDFSPSIPHALVTYRIDSHKYSTEIIEEIAIGQTLGAWDTKHVSEEILKRKVAKIVNYSEEKDFFNVTLAFNKELWHGNLSWLLTIIYGKMSFYPSIQITSVNFSENCKLNGPKFDINDIRKLILKPTNAPLLMGILKPNVAMSAENIGNLYFEAASSGIDILKDDEIRFDENINEVLKRIEIVSSIKEKQNLNTMYVPHFQVDVTKYQEHLKLYELAGAQAILINTWTCGLDLLQQIRRQTSLPIFSHPALVGAFGFTKEFYTIHPRVTLAQLIRAAGADFSLFPSPYGKLGLSKNIALDIAYECSKQNQFKAMTPVPSAGIKPEHAPVAKVDFGNDFVLNAGTGIFSGSKTIKENITEFKKYL